MRFTALSRHRLCAAILLLALGACSKEPPPPVAAKPKAAPAPVPAQSALTESGLLPGETLVELPGEGKAINDRFRAEALPLLEKHDFAAVEAMAAELRASKAQLPSGHWRLDLFYRAIADLDKLLPDSVWENRRQLLEEWVKARPASITARVALAEFLVKYAWEARGGGWAHAVTEEGWKLMRERLKSAQAVLEAAMELEETCPVLYTVYQTVSLGRSWPREADEKILRASIKEEPDYAPPYLRRAYYLQPRWFGKNESEWLEFATAEANRVGGADGDLLYARMLCYIFDLGIYKKFLAQPGLNWPRLKQGLEIMVQRFPDSLWAKSQLCYFCGQKGDKARCRELWKEIGSRVDTSLWDRERFLANRAWALK